MFCKNCGASVADGMAFCQNCGAPVAPAAPGAQPETSYQQPQYQQAQYQQPQYQQPSYQQAQYQQPSYQQGGGYRVNIKNRNIAVCILLSIVTCGIYGIIWFIDMVNDLNTASGRTGDTSGGMVFLLSLVTCGIYSWFWLYQAGEKVDAVHGFNGEAKNNPGIMYIVLALFGLGIVDYCLIQNELNKVAALQ